MKNYLAFKRKIKKNFNYGVFAMLCLVLGNMVSCKQENLRSPLMDSNNSPDPVSNVHVEPLHGAVKLTYDLPTKNSYDLLYTQANYEIRPGVKKEKAASFYGNELLLEGFGDTTERKVTLFTVNRSGNRSDSVTVMVRPLKSPVQLVYDSLKYFPDFGGIDIHIVNKNETDLMIGVLIKQDGDWIPYDKEFTSLPEGLFTIRNLKAELTTFGVYIRDRWNNYSDTLVQDLTPLFEEKLDENKFKEVILQGDGSNTWNLAGLWDGKPGSHQGIHASNNNGTPAQYEFSLGVNAKISRFKFWGIIDGREYSSANIKDFQIWGRNDINGADSTDKGWTLMGTFEVKKPSGLPAGQYTDDDRATAAAGDDFAMPAEAPAVKYIRIRVLSTFATPPNSPSGSVWLTQLAFWGKTN